MLSPGCWHNPMFSVPGRCAPDSNLSHRSAENFTPNTLKHWSPQPRGGKGSREGRTADAPPPNCFAEAHARTTITGFLPRRRKGAGRPAETAIAALARLKATTVPAAAEGPASKRRGREGPLEDSTTRKPSAISAERYEASEKMRAWLVV
jgi:hypothetical protein